jgi:hypothetical protein
MANGRHRLSGERRLQHRHAIALGHSLARIPVERRKDAGRGGIAAVCEELNKTSTRFSGTKLQLRFAAAIQRFDQKADDFLPAYVRRNSEISRTLRRGRAPSAEMQGLARICLQRRHPLGVKSCPSSATLQIGTAGKSDAGLEAPAG